MPSRSKTAVVTVDVCKELLHDVMLVAMASHIYIILAPHCIIAKLFLTLLTSFCFCHASVLHSAILSVSVCLLSHTGIGLK